MSSVRPAATSPALTRQNSRSRTSTSANLKTMDLFPVTKLPHPPSEIHPLRSEIDPESIKTVQSHAPRVPSAPPAEELRAMANFQVFRVLRSCGNNRSPLFQQKPVAPGSVASVTFRLVNRHQMIVAVSRQPFRPLQLSIGHGQPDHDGRSLTGRFTASGHSGYG